MEYKNVFTGTFIERPNRFIARVLINGDVETVHVKNTGRCNELLIKNSKVYLEKSVNPQRKTKYDLIAVEKETYKGITLINMDSQIPNDVVYEWLKNGELFSKNALIKREVKYGNSRFDIFVEDADRKAFIEVKGVTLENDGIAAFPDAPTERGIKHINELCECVKNGYEAYIIFVIQMKGVKCFTPNDITHKAFGDALRNAFENGVKVLAYDCIVSSNSISIDKPVRVSIFEPDMV